MKVHRWHLLFSLFFASLVIALIVLLERTYGMVPWRIPLFDALLVTLATFRLTRLFAYDSITAFIRGWFDGKSSHSFLGTLGTLINCPWCLGLWFALVVSFAYFYTPYAWFPIFFLAVAGVASFVQISANLVGWSAEERKQSVRSRHAEPERP